MSDTSEPGTVADPGTRPVFRQVTLEEAGRHAGVVVVIDVLRAFSVAAMALQAGARAVRCVTTVDAALTEAAANPGSLSMGESDDHRRGDLDLPNSPSAVVDADVAGRLIVHRSRAGTQGIVAAAPVATSLYAASFLCAGATARCIADENPAEVAFVLTGVGEREGDEDRACADYLTELLQGHTPDPAPYLERVRTSDTAALFDPGTPDLPPSDVELCARIDTVDFALHVPPTTGHPTIYPRR